MQRPEAGLAAAAAAVLRQNDAGAWTKPSPNQYPHQWNWDSAFISLGWSWIDWQRAVVELESLIAARWREGMLPHVQFDRRHLEDYFPGPDWWPRAQLHVVEPGRLTSGISNPPMVVVAAWLLGLRQPDIPRRHAFWRRNLPALAGFVRYLSRHRRLADSPLVTMVHPWESGWDNSPRWDFLAASQLKPRRPYVRLDTRHVSARQRPAQRDYDAYLGLVELLDSVDYDVAAYAERSPFCVNDVVMDALWYRAAEAANEMAAAVAEPRPFGGSELAAFAVAFEERHWDGELETYLDFDCQAGARIHTRTAAGLAALAGGLADGRRARAMWERYEDLQRGVLGVCSVPPGEPGFDPVRYWRGPIWAPVNWLVAEGLERSGLEREAEGLRAATLGLVERAGFAEYFDPTTGNAAGAGDFSWTAGLTLELLERQKRGKPVGDGLPRLGWGA